MNSFEHPKETIIYGGAFNPPTRAHQSILQACINRAMYADADVWLLPSGERADKHIGVSREQRIELIGALCADVALRGVHVDIETQELDQAEQTETFETVMKLQERFPDRSFTWVFGSDSVNTMAQWHNGQWLLDNLPMLVVERPGTPLQQLGRYATKLPVDMMQESSTQVRERLAANLPVDDLVGTSVARYLANV
jgi:nicotinate-nucleotide adenylyltransferase